VVREVVLAVLVVREVVLAVPVVREVVLAVPASTSVARPASTSAAAVFSRPVRCVPRLRVPRVVSPAQFRVSR
jgi:hypothetical protein